MAEAPRVRAEEGSSIGVRLLRILGVLVVVLVAIAAIVVRADLPVHTLQKDYAAEPSRFVVIDGMEVHYRDEGPKTGTPLLLLHGTSSSLHTWEGWAVRMKERRRVVRLDLPGFGLTGPRPDHDYRTLTYVAFIARFLDAMQIERADVAGNSFGGRIAWALAATRPERVRKLVLVDASGLPDMPIPGMLSLARTPARILLRWCTPDFLVRRSVEQVYADPSLVEDALVERHARLLRREGNRQAMIDRINTPDPPSLVSRLRDIRAETLILWGEQDRWLSVQYSHDFRALIPKSRRIVYEDAGHVPMEERAEETARDVTAFLEGRPLETTP